MQDHAEQVYSDPMLIRLQSYESRSFGLTFKFDDSQQLIIEEMQTDGIANMVYGTIRVHHKPIRITLTCIWM
jgi:hypothetical protein